MAIKVVLWECDECSYVDPYQSTVERHEAVYKHHNALRCKNGDHDDCLRAQLASGNQGGAP